MLVQSFSSGECRILPPTLRPERDEESAMTRGLFELVTRYLVLRSSLFLPFSVLLTITNHGENGGVVLLYLTKLLELLLADFYYVLVDLDTLSRLYLKL